MEHPDGEVGDSFAFLLRDHPLRASLSNEMHGRKLPPITPPARLMQVILSVEDQRLEEERAALSALLEPHSQCEVGRYVQGSTGGVHVIWERHTEFSSYMLMRMGEFDLSRPFEAACFDALPADWFSNLPGDVIRATQLAIVPACLELREDFDEVDLVCCGILDGLAELRSDFRLNDDGFGHLLIVDKGMTPVEVALAVQRVQELGNYRNLALLGLPIAQGLAPRVAALEQRLAETTQKIAGDAEPDEPLLRSLSNLSADIARVVADTQYRMNASRAYAEMVEDRLRSLRIQRVPGQQTLGDFTERRLLPAVRTCISFSHRLDALSRRAAWTSSLLRTRVDTELALQNRDLLVSMNHRTALQLRLQQTVEGLSVVAITYYATGLLGHLLDGIALNLPFSNNGVTAVCTPVIMALALALAWLTLRGAHRRLERHGPSAPG